MLNSNGVKIVLTSHGAWWKVGNSMKFSFSLDKQHLPQRLDEGCWIRLGISNRRFGWLCQPIRSIGSFLPGLRGSTARKACTIEVIQLFQNRKIKTESSNFFCSLLSTTKTMVSVKPSSFGWLDGGRGYIVLQTRRKVAMKQYENYSQDCKYVIRRFNSKPGDVLQDKGKRILSDIWRRNLQNPSCINERLWSVLKHDDVWISSFLKITGNQGFSTPETDNSQIAHFSLDKVMAVKRDLLTGQFRWSDNQCTQILEAEEKKTSNFRNCLVQEVLRRLLSPIYEPCFKNYSHGFRPGRSRHTALRDVRKSFKGCKWILEGNISHFFDNISHLQLISLLKKKIKDERIISLISKGLKSKVLVPRSGEIIHPKSGIPQGGILSPLLSNIYLHELDKYMATYIKEFNASIIRPHSAKCRKVAQNLENQKFSEKLSSVPMEDMYSDSFTRMRYVRHANSFIVGLTCSRAKSLEIKNHIRMFLKKKLHLELNNPKTLLLVDVSPKKHFNHSSQASFLGYLISMHGGINNRTFKNGHRLFQKSYIVLKVDQQKIINELAARDFCTKDGLPKPKFTYIHDTQAVTNEKINIIFQGIIDYYKLANNIRHFGRRLFYIFSHSLAKMYAAKYRWHKRAVIFYIGGRDLSQPLLTKHGKELVGCRTQDSFHKPIKGIIYSCSKNIPKPAKAPFNLNYTVSFNEIYEGYSKETQSIQELLRKYAIEGPIKNR